MPGKMKSFIDRFHALDLEEFKKRKRKLVVLGTFQEENIDLSGYNEVVQTFRYIAKKMNLEFIYHAGIRLNSEGKVDGNDALDQVYELGKKI